MLITLTFDRCNGRHCSSLRRALLNKKTIPLPKRLCGKLVISAKNILYNCFMNLLLFVEKINREFCKVSISGRN